MICIALFLVLLFVELFMILCLLDILVSYKFVINVYQWSLTVLLLPSQVSFKSHSSFDCLHTDPLVFNWHSSVQHSPSAHCAFGRRRQVVGSQHLFVQYWKMYCCFYTGWFIVENAVTTKESIVSLIFLNR